MFATVEAKKPPSSPHFLGDQEDPTAGVKLSASTWTMLWEKYGTSCETSVAGRVAALTLPAVARTKHSIVVASVARPAHGAPSLARAAPAARECALGRRRLPAGVTPVTCCVLDGSRTRRHAVTRSRNS